MNSGGVGAALRAARVDAGRSLREAAAFFGLSAVAYSALERGVAPSQAARERDPLPYPLAMLAGILFWVGLTGVCIGLALIHKGLLVILFGVCLAASARSFLEGRL